MNNLKELLNEYNIKVNGFKYLGKTKILNTNQGKIVCKENSNNYDIYEYLKTRDFPYFPRTLNNKNNDIELLEYIETKEVPDEQKLNDLIHLSGILHRKTMFNKEIDMDLVKETYESMLNQALYLRRYYEDLNNYIDTIVFMAPSEYLLVSNIDLIYYLLDFVRIEINTWYHNIKEKKTIRYSLIHNNLDLSHILESDNKYLISWSKSRLDMPITDILKLYQDNYYDLNLEDFLNEYESENRLNDNEYLFFLLKLSLVKKIEFSRNTFEDCYNINKYLVYLKKIAVMVQKYEEKFRKV